MRKTFWKLCTSYLPLSPEDLFLYVQFESYSLPLSKAKVVNFLFFMLQFSVKVGQRSVATGPVGAPEPPLGGSPHPHSRVDLQQPALALGSKVLTEYPFHTIFFPSVPPLGCSPF